MSYQQTIILGNLGSDPQMRYTPDGAPVTNFSVAVNEKWDGGEKVTWFKVVAWRKLAETCNQYLTKGKQVLVVGTVQAEGWADKNTGEVKSQLVLTAKTVKFLGGKTEGLEEPTSEELPF